MKNFPIIIDDNVKIIVSQNLEDMTTYILLEFEDWFEQEIGFIRSFVAPDTQAYDIGANHGVYAFSMAARMGRGGHVWAFEPTRKPLEMLHASIIENGFQDRVTIVPCALSDHAGIARMGTSALSETNSLQNAQGETEEVRLDTLDAAWEAQGAPAIDIVKLDAEGEEENILKGGKRFFATCSPLVMFEVKSSATHNMALPQAFRDFGYDLYRLIPGLGILVPLRDGEELDAFQINLFACKPDRATALETRGLLVIDETSSALSRPLPSLRPALAAHPYAEAFNAGWRDGVADTGLAILLAAQQADRPAAERWTLLRQGLAFLDNVLQSGDHPAIQLGRMRAQRCAGQYAAAGRTLRSLTGLTPARLAEALAEHPFLPAFPSWDDRSIRGTAEQWCAAMMADMRVGSAHYSTYFEQTGWPALWEVRDNPNLTDAMRRSLVLPMLRAGFRNRISGDQEARLLLRNAEHVNDGAWRTLLAS